MSGQLNDAVTEELFKIIDTKINGQHHTNTIMSVDNPMTQINDTPDNFMQLGLVKEYRHSTANNFYGNEPCNFPIANILFSNSLLKQPTTYVHTLHVDLNVVDSHLFLSVSSDVKLNTGAPNMEWYLVRFM